MRHPKEFHIAIRDAVLSESRRYRADELFRWSAEAALAWAIGRRPEIPSEAQELAKGIAATYLDGVRANAPFTDILGAAYMEIAASGHRGVLGQYFTPAPVARMMAAMTFGDNCGKPKPNGDLWRTCDPASGSGALMLAAAAHLLTQHGKEALKHWSFTLVDLDPMCSLMSAAQMLANCAVHGLTLGELVVFRGNSLAPASDWTLIVHATAKRLPRAQLIPAKHPARVGAIRRAAGLHAAGRGATAQPTVFLLPWRADHSGGDADEFTVD